MPRSHAHLPRAKLRQPLLFLRQITQQLRHRLLCASRPRLSPTVRLQDAHQVRHQRRHIACDETARVTRRVVATRATDAVDVV